MCFLFKNKKQYVLFTFLYCRKVYYFKLNRRNITRLQEEVSYYFLIKQNSYNRKTI